MIYTCTMNPSLDYYLEFHEELSAERTNRSSLEYYEAGGKGINVSIVLNNLSIPSRALGFVGGFTKDFYISLLAKYEYILPNFTYIDGHTRINVKCISGRGLDLNATGPYITHENMENLMRKTERLDDGDYFVLAGVTQEYLQEDTKKMLRDLISCGVRVVLDTNPLLMKDILKDGPFLIKTTPEELCELTGMPCDDRDGCIAAAKKVHEDGCQYVIVLRDAHDALFVSEEGGWECEVTRPEHVINTVGTGDSLAAGFLMNYMRSRDALDSFRFAASCGSATAYSKGLATREKIDAVYENTAVRKVDE
ncbi:MAG: 1-phosphofructokinase family hexose kinase [Solobacterium sp.]|nr:1-phosphofructokinase family hexose kinase [Solobacterium sp.]